VIAGHGRLAAARLLGLAEVPVILLKGVDGAATPPLMLADNRIALNAGWDLEMLALSKTSRRCLLHRSAATPRGERFPTQFSCDNRSRDILPSHAQVNVEPKSQRAPSDIGFR
jgi:hypothetical protein